MGENSENKTRLTTEIDIRSYLYSNGEKKAKKKYTVGTVQIFNRKSSKEAQ